MLMDILIVLAVALEAYLLGSVNTGILVSKLVYHDDVRNHGSGAAGMTNMLRTFGKKAAAMTAAGDVCKGILAVCIGRWLFSFSSGGSFSPYLGVYLAGILAVVGHTKPIYFGFKGGKGVLVAGGAILAVQLGYGLLTGLPARDLAVTTIGAAIMGAMVFYMHRANLQRIREGKEYRFGRKGKQQDNTPKQ